MFSKSPFNPGLRAYLKARVGSVFDATDGINETLLVTPIIAQCRPEMSAFKSRKLRNFSSSSVSPGNVIASLSSIEDVSLVGEEFDAT